MERAYGAPLTPDCLDPQQLAALQAGGAARAEAQHAYQHFLRCADCAARWAGLGRGAPTLGSEDGVAPAAAAAAEFLGRRVEGYRVTREIGRGGRGAVYEAVQEGTGLRAAVKVLAPAFRRHPGSNRRFRAEGRAPALVRHPGLVTVFNYGQLKDGTAYILMEYLEGPTLRERLAGQGGRLSLDQALRTARQIASALDAVHRHGIVHRDLKPANVIIAPDPDVPAGERAIVVDFGVARFNLELAPEGAEAAAVTGDRAFVGTVAYAAPEQCRGDLPVGGAADVYALGVLLYEVLAGAVPFAGTPAEVMAQHLDAAPRPLRELAPGVPSAVCELVHRMLAKDPGQRPTAEQVRAALDRLLPEGRGARGVHVGWLVAAAGLAGAGAVLLHFLAR